MGAPERVVKFRQDLRACCRRKDIFPRTWHGLQREAEASQRVRCSVARMCVHRT